MIYSLLILLVYLPICYATITIEVDLMNGIDNVECGKSGKKACKTLDYVLKNAELNDRKIELLTENHLSYNHTLYNVNNLTISTAIPKTNLSCLKNNSGLQFVFSNNITIKNLDITNCGTEFVSPSEFRDEHPVVNIVFSFTYCKNVHIEDTTFNKNQGLAVSLINVNGFVTIKGNNFTSNYDTAVSKGRYPTGGGLFIKFSRCNALYPFNCNNTTPGNYNHDAKYIIHNNTFYNNTAVSHYDGSSESLPLNNGAGIGFYLLGNSHSNTFDICNCHFERNIANWGAAIFSMFEDHVQNNSITFRNSSFINNIANYAGGAVRMRWSFRESIEDNIELLENNVNFWDINFIDNTAIWGGAVSIAGSSRTLYAHRKGSRNLNFTRCNFDNNSATVGFAMGFATENNNADVLSPAPSYQIVIDSCSFNKNFMALKEDKKVIGHGAVYAHELSVLLVNTNNFTENNYTAIVLDSSVLSFGYNSDTLFKENSGLEGGAIALYGSSFLMLSPLANILFKNNSAHRKGGAIYYKYGGPPRLAFHTTKLQSAKCFLQCDDCASRLFNDWKVHVKFVNNTAPKATGNSVYASTLQFCRNSADGRQQSSAFDWSFVTFENSIVVDQPEVVTNAVSIEVDSSEWDVHPDLPYTPSVIMADEKNQSVYGSIKLQFTTPGFILEPPNNIFLIKDKISRLRIDGPMKRNYSFHFLTTSGQMINTFDYQAKTKSCGLGYKPDTTGTKCICMNSIRGVVIRCNGENVSILKGHWGYKADKTSLLDVAVCPVRFCKCEVDEQEQYLCKFNLTKQCVDGRKGILCSQCEDGLSVRFGNEECSECSNIWLLLLIPMLFCTLLFVFLIFWTNVDAFSGYLNCFLYCYQIVTLLLPENVELDPFISFVIGIASLQGTGGNFGFCFFNGMTNLHKLPINYILPSMMIMWSVIIGAFIPQKTWDKVFCRNAAQNEREEFNQRFSFGRALSFVLVICYAAFTVPTLKLLQWVNINGKRVLFDAAYVEFFKDEHLWFGLLAILVLLFIVILFPVILLFTSFFLRRFSFFGRYRPVIEALRSCYRETRYCQWFVVYYFICRLLLQSVAVGIAVEYNRLICLTVLCVLIQVVFAAIQPYKYTTYNLWDILLLTDMCIISLFSMILSAPFSTTDQALTICKYALKVLVYIPFITLFLRFIVWGYKRIMYATDAVDGKGNPRNNNSRFIKLGRIMGRFRNSYRNRVNLPTRVNERYRNGSFETNYEEVNS